MILVAALQAALSPGAPGRPYNVVLIMADDCSPREFSFHGNTENQTPVLDALGAEGIRFRSAWCTPICNPTRTEIMTGCYGFRTHRYHNNMNIATPLTDDGYILFGNWLRGFGYATAVTGKWQLPIMWDAYGFDEHCLWAYENYIPDDTPPEIRDHWFELPGKPSRYWHPAVLLNGVYMDTVDTDYGPDIYVDFAIDFMTRKKDQPFLLYYPMALTHGKFYPTPDSIQPGEDPMVNDMGRNFGPMVEYTDKMVGRIIDALDSILLADGVTPLRNRTIVMFCTDNATSSAGKGDPSENGCNSPLIVNCPGVVPPVGWSDELVDFTDFLPTLVDLAGMSLPVDYVHDGRSFAPYILGESATTAREWMFSYLAHHRMLRDKRWLWEPPGRLYDTGGSRDGTGYVDVTDSTDPEVMEARARFAQILEALPAPSPDDPAYPKWHKYVRTLNTVQRQKLFLNTDPLDDPPPPPGTVDTPFSTGPLTAAGAQTAGNPVIHFGTGAGSTATARTADVTLTNFDTGVDFDGIPGSDTISGTFTVTATGSNGTNNAINTNTDLNGIRPVLGFDEATMSLSLSGWTLTAVNGASPQPGVGVTLAGIDGFTFGLDDFSAVVVVGVQTASGVTDFDDGTSHTDGSSGALFSFDPGDPVVIGKGIGNTSAPGTMQNEVRIGGVNPGQGLSFRFTGHAGGTQSAGYDLRTRTDAWRNVLVEVARIPRQDELLLEFSPDMAGPGSWSVVDRYTPETGEVGHPFRFDQFQSLHRAFYRVRSNP